MTQAVTSQPVTKRKTYQYTDRVIWTQDRSGLVSSAGKSQVPISSPPEFKGEPGVWTPEDLFVSAVNSCTMATFLAYAFKAKLPLYGYTSEATGTLEYSDGKYRFTKVHLYPEITVGTPEAMDQVLNILGDAHRDCFISNSIQSEVVIEPIVRSLK